VTHGAAARPRVAIVHERFTDMAGSEAVVEQLARQWPQASVHAPVARQEILPEGLRGRVVDTPLSRLLRGGTYAHLLPVLPVAMARLPLPPADVVITSHHAFSQQVVHATTAPVVSYVHTPARWVWDPAMRAGEVGGRLGAAGLAAFAAAYRGADRRAAQRVHTLVANSTEVAGRVRRWWGREAQVVHPPVDVDRCTPDPGVQREPFFLLAGRLVPYKRPDVAVAAAAAAGVRLVVVGDGRHRAELERVAGPGTTFLGRVPDEQLLGLYRRCRALLMPGVEDFGIVPVEAQATGAPVIAQAAGGALDSVVDGVTGTLVPGADPQRWAQALRDFDPSGYDPRAVRRHAEAFSHEAFRSAMAAVVDGVLRQGGRVGSAVS
jgi:glycosyltransferase involved in cell wall biosynthesis